MPLVDRTNNRVLPPNVRNSDVATQAINGLTDVQQQKYHAAFRVQGFQAIHYARASAGFRCTCQAERKNVNTVLDKDGKASPGVINGLLTGHKFGTSRYGTQAWSNPPPEGVPPYDPSSNAYAPPTREFSGPGAPDGGDEYNITSPEAPVNKHQGVFDIATRGGDFPIERVINPEDGDDFGDNGPVRALDFDELIGQVDMGPLSFGDTGCPVCFGTGFVGGFAPLYGQRLVISVPEQQLKTDSEILFQNLPWAAQGVGFTKVVTLPRGAIGVDASLLWNVNEQVPYTMQINGTPINRPHDLLRFCVGQPVLMDITVAEGTIWTHLELQFNLNQDSAYFEFPKLQSGSDLSLLELTEPFTIVLSPIVPSVNPMDVITDSVYGKALIVQNSNPWQSRASRMLGWEVQVRALQPQEMLNLLPRRGRVPTQPVPTNLVHDNVTGPRRT
jgi:hypothetical protein